MLFCNVTLISPPSKRSPIPLSFNLGWLYWLACNQGSTAEVRGKWLVVLPWSWECLLYRCFLSEPSLQAWRSPSRMKRSRGATLSDSLHWTQPLSCPTSGADMWVKKPSSFSVTSSFQFFTRWGRKHCEADISYLCCTLSEFLAHKIRIITLYATKFGMVCDRTTVTTKTQSSPTAPLPPAVQVISNSNPNYCRTHQLPLPLCNSSPPPQTNKSK